MRCLPRVVAEWTAWVCPCGHDIADHALWSRDAYCEKCRCPKAYLGYQRSPEPAPSRDDPTPSITVNGIELIEVQP